MGKGHGDGQMNAAIKICSQVNPNGELFKRASLKADTCVMKCKMIMADVDALLERQKLGKVHESKYTECLLAIAQHRKSIHEDDRLVAEQKAKNAMAKSKPLDMALDTVRVRKEAFQVRFLGGTHV
jgi:hypothetical protein